MSGIYTIDTMGGDRLSYMYMDDKTAFPLILANMFAECNNPHTFQDGLLSVDVYFGNQSYETHSYAWDGEAVGLIPFHMRRLEILELIGESGEKFVYACQWGPKRGNIMKRGS